MNDNKVEAVDVPIKSANLRKSMDKASTNSASHLLIRRDRQPCRF